MKLVFSRNDLQKGVNIVSKAVPAKTTMSILKCILISADEEKITLLANDMELGIETKVEGEIVEGGVIALDASILSEIVRKIPDADVVLETDSNYTAVITCENARFTIPGKSGEDFTYLPDITKEQGISLTQLSLREVIRQTIFSIAANENNRLMTGELFELNGNILKVASLDGHRISIRKIGLANNYDKRKVVVPGKTLNEISKILSGEADQKVDIYFCSQHIVFEFNDTVVVSRLIEGEYFRIEQMLSSDYETKVTVNKKAFADCIDRSTLLVKEGEKKPIIVNITDDYMQLRMESPMGSMKEDIPVEKTGKDIVIGFNPKFLIDALRVIDEEEVTVYLVNSKAPCFIQNDEETYTYLILPVNINV